MEDARELTTQVTRSGPAKGARQSALLGTRAWVWVALLLILSMGAYFRFVGLDWDQGQRLHPDERFLTEVLAAMSRPASLHEYFNTADSGWNPHNVGADFFSYGTLPLFIIRFVGEVLGKTGETEIYLVGRALSGLFDLATVLLLFFIARRLYDTRVALLAAALSTAAVLQIQQSHFMTVDTFAAFFATLTLLFAVRAAEEGRTRDYLPMGLALGLAVSSRINLALLGGVAAIAGGLYVWRVSCAAADQNRRRQVVTDTIVRLALAALVSVVAFRIFQPYAFQGPGVLGLRLNSEWLSDVLTVRSLVSGEIDYPPSYQWVNRPAYLFPLSHMVLWGLGLPLGLTAWGGVALAGWQILQRRQWQHVLPVVWVLVEFGYQGGQFVKTMRYFLPIYPTLAMLAAFLLVWLWNNRLRIAYCVFRNRSREHAIRSTQYAIRTGILPGTLLLLVMAGTYLWGFAFARIYTRPQTRIAASRWIYEHVPTAATLYYATSSGTVGHTHVPVRLPSDGAGAETSRFEYLLTDGTGVLYDQTTHYTVSAFTLSEPAVVQSVSMNYLADPAGDSEPETFEVVLAADPGGRQILARGQITVHLENADRSHGRACTIDLSGGPRLEPDREYYLLSRVVAGGPVEAWSSVLAAEYWDYPLPLPVEGRNGYKVYHVFRMHLYDEDSLRKLDDLLAWLDQADYIVIASNRLYGSITRLSEYYPITSEYYRLLFEEKLGFELEKTFTSYPNIGPIEIPDQSAEEVFTVYDHPKVWIFRKTDDFSRARAYELLVDAARGPFISLSPLEKAEADAPLELPPDQWVRQQRAGTWSAIFDRDSLINTSTPLTILVWLLAVELIGLAAFPFAFVVFSRLADRGYVLSKVLGLILVAWVVWFVSSLTSLPYARWSIGLCLLILASLSAIIAYRRRTALTRFMVENRRLLLIGETLFLFAFLAFLLVRMGNPDLWHPARGGEKPMDLAYLNAVIKSRTFPPYDPWFAGGYINYYYFGFVIVGTLIKLLGIVPAKAYNLAVPTLFALTFVGAFVVVYNLVISTEKRGLVELKRRLEGQSIADNEVAIRNTQYATRNRVDTRAIRLGIFGGLFVAVIGNLGEIQLLLEAARNISLSGFAIPGGATLVGAARAVRGVMTGHRFSGIPNDWWFWNASRLMPNGEINEFPYFTFLYADLHAHMIALPVTLLALGMAVQVIRGAVQPRTLSELGVSLAGPPDWPARIDWVEIGQLSVWALIIGSLRAINTWDYPTYLLVAAGALGIRQVWRRGRIDAAAVWAAGWRFGVVAVLSVLFFWPYIQHYVTAYSSAELWHGARTALGDYLTIHAFFLFILVTFLIIQVVNWWRQGVGPGRRSGADGRSTGDSLSQARQRAITAVMGLAALGLLYFRMWVPLLGVVLGVPAAVSVLRTDVNVRRWFLGLVFLVGLILTLAVEFVVLKGDIGRMNTVFKFYIQVWGLWGVAAAAALAWLIPRIRRWTPTLRQAWWGALAVLFAAVLLYPLLATPAKLRDRFDPSLGPGLSGTAFMRTAVYYDQDRAIELQYDRQAIRWMQENIPGTPVVLEAHTPEYRWGSRVAIYTGLPTVIGWRWHQQQQRSVLPGNVVDRRIDDVRTIYSTRNPQAALDLMADYDVSYVYVGPLERAYYDPKGLAKFEQMAQAGMLKRIYQNPEVTLYRVVG